MVNGICAQMDNFSKLCYFFFFIMDFSFKLGGKEKSAPWFRHVSWPPRPLSRKRVPQFPLGCIADRPRSGLAQLPADTC